MAKIMLDLETMGTRAGCAVLSIGAVEFNETTMKTGKEFHKIIALQSCLNAGLFIDASTKQWWDGQSEEAKKTLHRAVTPDEGVDTLEEVLKAFNTYLARFDSVEIYGNGADFDNPILLAAYHAAGVPVGWRPFNGRCYRTLKNDIAPHIEIVRTGTYHNALDDARSQALHAMEILKYLRELKERDEAKNGR